MSTAKKYENIFEILEKAREKDGLDPVCLHNEIRKEIEAGERTLGMFLDVVESLRDIIPKEKQRYNAAVRALSKTTGQSQQNLLESTDKQLEELGNVEKAVFSSLTGLGDELREMDSRLKKTKDELVKLREKIAELEKEEQEILGSMAARERDNKVVEQAVSKVFKSVGAEIAEVRKKIEEFACEKAPAQPVTPPEPVESEEVGEEEKGVETVEAAAPQETKWTKKCLYCGGSMNFHTSESMWKCYTCGNEEMEKEDTEGEPVEAAMSATAPEPVAAPEPVTISEPAAAAESAADAGQKLTAVAEPLAAPAKPLPSFKHRSPRKKTCPVCHKQMTLDEDEHAWKCPFCSYQRPEF